MNPSSKQFKALQDKWYKKLKDSGFEDIEQDEHYLKRSSTNFLSSNFNYDSSHTVQDIVNKIELKTEYFRLARHFLNDHKFKNKNQKYIWAQHSEGVSHRTITEDLKKRGVNIGRTTVLKTIAELRELMLKKNKEAANAEE
jgi:hypothetical protein